MNIKKAFSHVAIACTLCSGAAAAEQRQTIGQIDRVDPAIDKLIAPGTEIEVLAEGFNWSEGPVWIADGEYVVFSDVPENIIYRGSEKDGLSKWREPSGYTGLPREKYKQGSNGLALYVDGGLLICEHGDRRLSKLDIKEGKRRVVADNYKGARFNSPNDVDVAKNGNIYMTDPTFGLEKGKDDPYREMDYMGVFLIRPNGEVVLLEDELEFPNGVGLSPDEKYLYVSQRENWWRYPVKKDGTVGKRELLFSAAELVAAGHRGPTDGLSIDANGNLWVSAPGGTLVLSPEGKLLGRIDTGRSVANNCFGNDGYTFYMTADNYLCRIRTLVKGKEFDR